MNLDAMHAFAAPALMAGKAESLALGGQAVMEGVVMRSAQRCALAVRLPDGTILVEHRPWMALTWGGMGGHAGGGSGGASGGGRKFLRGFPILVETLINGISALNRSADLEGGDEEKKTSRPQWALTLALALALAMALFVITPHLLTFAMVRLGLSGGMRGLSFHIWDGLFKFFILILYILVISRLAEIRRIFQYHGAEHKVIGAFEAGGEVSASAAMRHSRLHPRCGTAFLLFALLSAVVVHALLLPPLLGLWRPESLAARHAGVLLVKLLLLVPVTSLAYEFTRLAAGLSGSRLGRVMQAPGLLLQLLTTREPDRDQLNVAVAALAEALGEAHAARVQTPAYSLLE